MKVSTLDLQTRAWNVGTDVADWLDRFDVLPDLTKNAHWKVIDEGFVRFRSGAVRTRSSNNGDLTTRDVLILGKEGIEAYDGRDLFGMQLFEYEDLLGVNEKGEGFVIQPWVVSLTPGRIRWEIESPL